MLTKTNYLAYVQCAKQLWLEKNQPESATPPAPDVQRRMAMGQAVDYAARQMFPDGELIGYRPNPPDMATATQTAIATGASTLFQATFIIDDLLIKADILTRVDGGWHLVEAKATTKAKPEHIVDLAFQQYVLTRVGLSITQVSVMHINKEYDPADRGTLFVLSELTKETTAAQAQIAVDIARMRPLIVQADVPDDRIGRHCNKPYACPFQSHCWQGVDGLTIFDIPRLKADKEQVLFDEGVLYLRDVPLSAGLTASQQKMVDRVAQDKVEIDVAAISAELSTLTYPLYFFDFETIDYAIPQFENSRPYQQIPFQFSCHVLSAAGDITHHDFLHSEQSDPRPALIDALLAAIGETGSVIAYNIPFERGVLQRLAEAFPAHAERLTGIADRLWDQLPIFRKHYYHFGFGKSFSLKSVLPIVVPELSYDALEIGNGIMAQVAWERLVNDGLDSAEKQTLIDQLLEYCKLDTWAMVAIHQHLTELVRA